jgi:hypothetical protein
MKQERKREGMSPKNYLEGFEVPSSTASDLIK